MSLSELLLPFLPGGSGVVAFVGAVIAPSPNEPCRLDVMFAA